MRSDLLCFMDVSASTNVKFDVLVVLNHKIVVKTCSGYTLLVLLASKDHRSFIQVLPVYALCAVFDSLRPNSKAIYLQPRIFGAFFLLVANPQLLLITTKSQDTTTTKLL